MALKTFLLWLVLSVPALALEADEVLPNPAQEAAARAVERQIKCVVCAGEAVAESRATLARDMRKFIRQAIVAGQTPEQIKAQLQALYGDAILLTPPLGIYSAALYAAPVLLLLLAGMGGVRLLRHRRRR